MQGRTALGGLLPPEPSEAEAAGRLPPYASLESRLPGDLRLVWIKTASMPWSSGASASGKESQRILSKSRKMGDPEELGRVSGLKGRFAKATTGIFQGTELIPVQTHSDPVSG